MACNIILQIQTNSFVQAIQFTLSLPSHRCPYLINVTCWFNSVDETLEFSVDLINANVKLCRRVNRVRQNNLQSALLNLSEVPSTLLLFPTLKCQTVRFLFLWSVRLFRQQSVNLCKLYFQVFINILFSKKIFNNLSRDFRHFKFKGSKKNFKRIESIFPLIKFSLDGSR